MDRVDMVKMFSTPDFYQPPPVEELSTNTEYPNLNSLEYLKRPYSANSGSRRFNECLAVNELGNAVLATNRYTDRIWHGHFLGFETLDDVCEDVEKTCFKSYCNSPVTNIQYVESNLFLLADAGGTLELWSTKANVRSTVAYCLFNVGRQSEHTEEVYALDVFRADSNKAVSGSAGGSIKVWDMGAGDLYSTNTFRVAHTHAIKGISSSPTTADVFTSCSLDRCLNIWDLRLSAPIVAYNESHRVGFTTAYWTTKAEHDQEFIYVGDEAGYVHSVDPRNISAFVSSQKVFDSRVHRLRFNGSKYLVIGDTNEIKVFNVDQPETVIYANSQALDYVRDAHWTDANQFQTIGWEEGVRKHSF